MTACPQCRDPFRGLPNAQALLTSLVATCASLPFQLHRPSLSSSRVPGSHHQGLCTCCTFFQKVSTSSQHFAYFTSPLPRRLLYPFPGGPFLFFSYFLFVSSIVLLTVYKSFYFLSISIAWPSLSLLLLLLLPLSPECKLPEGRKVTNLFTSEPHRRECCLARSRYSTKFGE